MTNVGNLHRQGIGSLHPTKCTYRGYEVVPSKCGSWFLSAYTYWHSELGSSLCGACVPDASSDLSCKGGSKALRVGAKVPSGRDDISANYAVDRLAIFGSRAPRCCSSIELEHWKRTLFSRAARNVMHLRKESNSTSSGVDAAGPQK